MTPPHGSDSSGTVAPVDVPTKEETEAMIADVLAAYPPKTAKFRAKHLKPNDPEGGKECEVKSNIKSRPGVMTIRGCAYAG